MSMISKWNTSLKKSASRFQKDEGGQFAIMFAVTSIALTMAAGLALDTSRMFSAKTILNNAVDAAVLATTRDLTSGTIDVKDAEKAIADFLNANLDPDSVSGAPVSIDDIDIDKTAKTVSVDAHVMLPMTLTAIAGYDKLKVATSSKAEFNDNQIEIAMALDVTGSMGGKLPSGETRMEALKQAANNAIDILIPTSAAPSRVRIGLVPYAASVNAKPVLSKINYTGTSKGCVIERTGPKAYTQNFASYAHPVGGLNNNIGKNGCPKNEIVPLSRNAASLKTDIQALGTSGYTAGHVGIAWTQYMLSSQWNNAWPGDLNTGSDAAPASDSKTTKYAIIMTDGEFNTFLSNGKGNGAGSNQSRNYAKKICGEMKKGNIKIFSINFAGGNKAEKLMKNCATPNTANTQYFYSASDGAQLKKAFEDIAKTIKNLRLIG